MGHPKPDSEKAIIVTFPDGSQQIVAAEVVAHSRAKFYAAKGENYTETFLDTMGDRDLLLDWAKNEMNWADVAPYAREKADPKPITDDQRQEAWVNGELKVVRTPAHHHDLPYPDEDE
jgi:hypothetical protein